MRNRYGWSSLFWRCWVTMMSFTSVMLNATESLHLSLLPLSTHRKEREA